VSYNTRLVAIMTYVYFWTYVMIAANPHTEDTREKPHPFE